MKNSAKPVCGVPSLKTGAPCQKPPLKGQQRCKLHLSDRTAEKADDDQQSQEPTPVFAAVLPPSQYAGATASAESPFPNFPGYRDRMTPVTPVAKVIEHRSIDTLIPNARNARTHSDAQVAEIAGSIRAFGFNSPVLITDDGGIIAGHGRVLAARKLGISLVPCVVLDHLSPRDQRGYILADNRIAQNAGWDNDILALELADLNDLDMDLSTLGFAPMEIDTFLSQADATSTSTADTPGAPASEWVDMPEYQHEDQTSAHRLIVHFADLDDLQEFAVLVGQSLTEKTKFIWYPEAERADFASQRYAVHDAQERHRQERDDAA